MKYIFLALCSLIIPILASSPPPSCEAGGEENKVQHISLSDAHTCASFRNGEVKCWGRNSLGQLGLDDTVERGSSPNQMGDSLPFITFKDSESVSQITLGMNHSCAKFENGKVRCWGWNRFGQLGAGDIINRGSNVGDMSSLDYIDFGSSVAVEKIASGASHNCALLNDGAVKCWGANFVGTLGIGNTDSNLGDELSEVGEGLPVVDLGSKKVIDIVAGGDFTMVRLEDDTIKAWGANYHGQAGIGTEDDVGDEPGEMGANLTAVDLGFSAMTGDPKIENMCTSGSHSCVLYTREVNQVKSSHVKCWGNNQQGQLGLGDTAARGKNSNEMGANLPEVDLGQDANAVEVHCADMHTCALFDNGQVKCWGGGALGSLGMIHSDNLGDEPSEMGDNLRFVNLRDGRSALQLAVGGFSTCVLMDNYQVKCWGANSNGQLGLGDTLLRFVPTLPLNIGCFEEDCSGSACGHLDCVNPGCPYASSCATTSPGAISCTCDATHINGDWPERSTDVDPDGYCTPKFLADYEFVSPETIKISITKLLPTALVFVGLEVHKWTSEVDKEIVPGFQGQRIRSSPNLVVVTKEFSGFEPGFKYEITLFPLSLAVQPIGTVREGVYNQTLVVGVTGDNQPRGNSSTTSSAIAIGSGIAGGVMLVAAIAVFGSKKMKESRKAESMDVDTVDVVPTNL